MSAFKFSLEFCILVLDDFAVRGKGELEVTQVDKLAYFSGCTDSQIAFWSLFNLFCLDTFCLSVTTIKTQYWPVHIVRHCFCYGFHKSQACIVFLKLLE